MKSKHLLILAILLLVFGIASILLIDRERFSWRLASSTESKVLAPFDPNAVSQLEIKTNDQSITLIQKGESWIVAENDGYPADFNRVQSLIRKLWDLKAVQEVAIKPSQFDRLQLIPPEDKKSNTGTLVDLKDKSGKRLVAILAGKIYMRVTPDMPKGISGFPVGRYLVALDGKNRVVLVDNSFSELANPSKDWLNKDFLRIEAPQSISLQGSQGQWTLEHAGANDPWKLDESAALDASKADSIANAVRSLVFENVLATSSDLKKYDFSQPAILTIKTFDGIIYTLNIGKLQGETYPVKISVNADFRPLSDKGKLDSKLAENHKLLEARLKKEKRFENWLYLVPKFALTSTLVTKKELLPSSPSPTPNLKPSPAPATKAHPISSP